MEETTNVTRYYEVLLESLEARERGDDETETRLTGDLDQIWHSMSAAERKFSSDVMKDHFLKRVMDW